MSKYNIELTKKELQILKMRLKGSIDTKEIIADPRLKAIQTIWDKLIEHDVKEIAKWVQEAH